MQGYRVWYPEKGRAVLQEYKVREPGADEVMVQVQYTLISAGTEKADILGLPNTSMKFPGGGGYSSVGTIIKKGANVKEFLEGDRVFAAYGGHASYNVVNKSRLTKIPDSVPLTDAVFLKVISYPLLALRHARAELGESIAVVGLGMLGQFAVQIAKQLAVPLIAVGNREVRRQKALDFGADYAFDPNEENLAEKIISICEQTNGIRGANVVIDTSGSIDALISALKYTSKNGRVMLNGCNRITDKPIDLYQDIHKKGICLIGAHEQSRYPFNSAPGNWTAKRDYITIMRFLEKGRINARDMINEMVSPNDATAVYERLIFDRNFPLGVIFDWSEFHESKFERTIMKNTPPKM